MALLLAAGAGCDAGKAPFQKAVALEKAGNIDGALEAYDAVCPHAPGSRYCTQSTDAAKRLRQSIIDDTMARAKKRMDELKFNEAATLLQSLVDAKSTDPETKLAASALLGSPGLLAGLGWERASALSDKRAALKDIEDIAGTETNVAQNARDWLKNERPALLLEDAKSACTPVPLITCPSACRKLLALHPSSPQATEGKTLLTAWEAVDDARTAPLLVAAEKLMPECVEVWRQEKAHRDCASRLGGDAFATFQKCGDGLVVSQRADKLAMRGAALIAEVGPQSRHAETLKSRWAAACIKGEYARAPSPN